MFPLGLLWLCMEESCLHFCFLPTSLAGLGIVVVLDLGANLKSVSFFLTWDGLKNVRVLYRIERTHE